MGPVERCLLKASVLGARESGLLGQAGRSGAGSGRSAAARTQRTSFGLSWRLEEEADRGAPGDLLKKSPFTCREQRLGQVAASKVWGKRSRRGFAPGERQAFCLGPGVGYGLCGVEPSGETPPSEGTVRRERTKRPHSATAKPRVARLDSRVQTWCFRAPLSSPSFVISASAVPRAEEEQPSPR